MQALITSVSSQLYDATGGRGRFGSIEVTVPSGWNKEDCLRSRQLKPQSISEKAQIQVESPHPIFGSQPHAEQYGQCGVAGEQLTLPYTLLTDNVRVTQQSSKSNYYIKIKFYFPHFLHLDLGKCFML